MHQYLNQQNIYKSLTLWKKNPITTLKIKNYQNVANKKSLGL